jgi:PAS domain S-box-containing protein
MSPDSLPAFLTLEGEMADHIRARDWSATPLGPPAAWPVPLQEAVRLMLSSGHPMLIWWGQERIQLYNDAHVPALRPDRHPVSLGMPGAQAWPEGWETLAPQIENILSGQGASWHEHHPIPRTRDGRLETSHWTYSLNAIHDTPGGIGGVLFIGVETTGTVRALRAAEVALDARTTELLQAERNEARMRAIFETSNQFLGLLDTDGTLCDANPAALLAINATLPEVIGKKFWTTLWFTTTPGLAAQIAAAIARAAAGENIRLEIQLNLASGLRIFDFALHPVRDAAGAVIAIASEAIELTKWRAAEEKFRQAQKMEAVGQLTGGLAHDFNNLLTGISGSLDLLKTRIAQGRLAEAERYIHAAETSASRAAALTHRLLAFSRRQTLDPRPTQANALIAGMEDHIRRTIGPRIALHTLLAEGLWTILCDAGQLENAILNLCLNARDAMPDGGTLSIETENIRIDAAQARLRDMQPGAYAAIIVTDTGNGMAPEVVSRAFDPFFTTKPIGMGTGLGLSMIYGFTRQSGGQVRIHSAEGQGTTMRMFLPRHAENEAAAPAPAPVRPAGEKAWKKAGKTVLVVDDEPTVRMLVLEVLNELGYAALEAADGAAGTKILQSPARIDLLITDIGLPGGMNGRQMADAARLRRPGLKVMFITGYAEPSVIGNDSLGPGMEVMTKPFSLDALALRIKAMIAN